MPNKRRGMLPLTSITSVSMRELGGKLGRELRPLTNQMRSLSNSLKAVFPGDK